MNVLKQCFNLRQNENVLLISDNTEIIDLISSMAIESDGALTAVYLPPSSRPVAHLAKPLRLAIEESDVALTPFSSLSGESTFRDEIIDAVVRSTCRMGHMPGVDMDVFKNCIVKTDYGVLERRGLKMADALSRAKTAEISTKAGTKLKMNLGGWSRTADADFGLITTPGSWDNLPAGEACIAPIEGSTEGELVVDGSLLDRIVTEAESFHITFKKGRITKISEGNLATRLKELLESIDRTCKDDQKGNICNVAELGIGTNDKARLTGKTIEDEKKLGTVHVALGRNTFLGGRNDASRHIDIIVKDPTLILNTTKIIDSGTILWNEIEEFCREQYSDYGTEGLSYSDLVTLAEGGVRCSPSSDCLCVHWVAPAGRTHITMVGSADTSKLALKTYRMLDATGVPRKTNIQQVSRSLGIELRTAKQIIALMQDYRILTIKQRGKQKKRKK